MNPGPLRRLVGTIGLLALVPIAWQLFTGGLEPSGAAVRAVAVLFAVVLVGRVATRYLDSIARSVEQHRTTSGGAVAAVDDR